MKKIKVPALGDRENAFVKLLEDFGLRRSTSQVLVYLMVHDGSTIRDIGTATGLSAASVSTALKELRQDGIATADKHLEMPKNRVIMHFQLTGDISDVLNYLEGLKQSEVTLYSKEAAKVRTLKPPAARS